MNNLIMGFIPQQLLDNIVKDQNVLHEIDEQLYP